MDHPSSAALAHETRAPGIVGSAIALIIVSAVAVILRFWSRLVSTDVNLWWDDWTVLATTVFTIIFYAFSIAWTNVGLGRHQSTLSVSDITPNGVLAQVSLMFYDTAASLLKVSAAMLYSRIFRISRRFQWVVATFVGIVTVWWIILLVLPFTHCDPPRKLLYPMVKGTCSLKTVPWFLSTAIINFCLDLVVLIMPIPMVWALQLRLSRKLQLSAIFLLGYSSAFIGLARFILVVRNPWIISPLTDHDLTWNMVPNEILAIFELALGIVAVCGPPIRHLMQHGASKFGFGSLGSSRRMSTGYRSWSWRSIKGGSNQSSESEVENGNGLRSRREASIGQIEYSNRGETGTGAEIPMDTVLLKKDVQVFKQNI